MLSHPHEVADLLGIPFSDQQLAAIGAPMEPAVVIAGAGSGKTTVMAARVVWLVGSGQVRAEEVLGLTFTRKAAAELGVRVRRALADAGLADPEAGEPLIATYDAFAGRLIAEHGLLLGFEPGLRVISGAVPYRLAARVVADTAAALPQLSRLAPVTVAERVVGLATQLRSHLVEPEQVVRHAESYRAALEAAPRRGSLPYKAVQDALQIATERVELVELVGAYEQLKSQHGSVEFADQMAMAARLAREVPEVSAALRGEFAVVLLDEYQDTSAAQARLLRELFSGAHPMDGRGHPVTAVGDPCQAIYGWRGAAAGNILDFATEFPRRDGTPAAGYALTVNRRSGQRILDAANAIAGAVRSDPAILDRRLELNLVAPAGTAPGRVETAGFETWGEEVAALADRVADLQASGAVDEWSQVAVLCRRNDHVAEVFTALVERDVPAEIVGLGGLLDLPLVAEVVATLTLLADPRANPAAIRLLTASRWAIGLPDLALLGRRATELASAGASKTDGSVRGSGTEQPSLLEALADPGAGAYSASARQRFAEFTRELAALRRHTGDGLTELVARVISQLGVATEAEVAHPGASAPLGVLVTAVSGFAEAEADAELAGLLAWFEAERAYSGGLDQAVASEANSVKVLTVHKAKGLEWEVVFLPGLASGVFPAGRVTDNWVRNPAVLPYPLRGDAASLPQLGLVDHRSLEAFHSDLRTLEGLSEDRLAYVAVTRAKQLLVASTHSWAGELTRPRAASCYFDVLVDYADSPGVMPPVLETSPLVVAAASMPWPGVGSGEAFERRRAVAELVEADRQLLRSGKELPSALDADSGARAAQWRRQAEALLASERTDRAARDAFAAHYLSVTGVGRLNRDPVGFAAASRRPMPRRVSEAQRRGVGFHQWLENRFQTQLPLLDAEPELELAGADFDRLRAAFEAGPFADATPVAVEAPFTLVLGGQLVRGRIDAVFPTGDGGAQVVDWKTGNIAAADPLQLACYRLAWAELSGMAIDLVDAVFYDLHTATLVRPSGLPDRAALTRLVTERLSSLAR